jgi:hypothetical protein
MDANFEQEETERRRDKTNYGIGKEFNHGWTLMDTDSTGQATAVAENDKSARKSLWSDFLKK